jgi:hypothetical protein
MSFFSQISCAFPGSECAILNHSECECAVLNQSECANRNVAWLETHPCKRSWMLLTRIKRNETDNQNQQTTRITTKRTTERTKKNQTTKTTEKDKKRQKEE